MVEKMEKKFKDLPKEISNSFVDDEKIALKAEETKRWAIDSVEALSRLPFDIMNKMNREDVTLMTRTSRSLMASLHQKILRSHITYPDESIIAIGKQIGCFYNTYMNRLVQSFRKPEKALKKKHLLSISFFLLSVLNLTTEVTKERERGRNERGKGERRDVSRDVLTREGEREERGKGEGFVRREGEREREREREREGEDCDVERLMDESWGFEKSRLWKASFWVGILNRIAIFRGVAFSSADVNAWKKIFSQYSSLLSGTGGQIGETILPNVIQKLFLRMAVDVIEHFTTRLLDPCNCLIGCFLSKPVPELLKTVHEPTSRFSLSPPSLTLSSFSTTTTTTPSTSASAISFSSFHSRQPSPRKFVSFSPPPLIASIQKQFSFPLSAENSSDDSNTFSPLPSHKTPPSPNRTPPPTMDSFTPSSSPCFTSLPNGQFGEISNTKKFGDEFEVLKKAVLRWDCIRENPHLIIDEIADLASSLRSRSLVGALVAVHHHSSMIGDNKIWENTLEFPGLRYARVVSVSFEDVEISFEPTELHTVHVKSSDVVPLRFSPKSIEKIPREIVLNPLFFLFNELSEQIHHSILSLFDDSLDTTLILSAKALLTENLSFSHNLCRSYHHLTKVFSLKDVKRIQESLKKLEDLIPQKLNKDAISDLFRGVRNTVREWITHVSPPSLQLLNLTALLSQLESYLDRIPTLARFETLSFLKSLSHADQLLTQYSKAIASGQLKEALCTWWLGFIEQRADKILEQLGYVKDALPYNYTDVAPPSLKVVRKNLKIIQEVILKNADSESHLPRLIARSARLVHEILSPFRNDMEVLLQLLPTHFPSETGSIPRIQKDLDYLTKMKEMDEELFERLEGEDFQSVSVEMTDVVPISGLLMGRFHMVECELRTALEIWDQNSASFFAKGNGSSSAKASELSKTQDMFKLQRSQLCKTVSDPEVFFPLSSSYNEEEFKLLDGELISLMERMEGGGGGESRGSGPGPKMQVTTTPPSPLLLSEKDKHTDERSTKMLRSRTFREILRPKSVRMRQSPKKSFHLTPPVALSSSANRGNPLLERLSSTETSLSSLDRTKANPVPKDRRRSMTPVDQLETPPSSESKKKKKTHRRQNSRA